MAQLAATEIIIGSFPNQVKSQGHIINISKNIKIDSKCDPIMTNQTVIEANTSLPASTTDIGPMSSTNEIHYPERVGVTFAASSSQNPYKDDYINKLMASLPKLPIAPPSVDMIDILSEMETSSDWVNIWSPDFHSSLQFPMLDKILDEKESFDDTALKPAAKNHAYQSVANGLNVNNNYSSDYDDETKRSDTTITNILEKNVDEADARSHYPHRNHGKPLSYVKLMKANHLDYKKQQRNKRERQRRNDLKDAFELLREHLPIKKKITQHQILINAAVYCKILQLKEQKLLGEIEKLVNYNSSLIQQAYITTLSKYPISL